MGLEVTLGGDRLGSGKKMKTELNNYQRSTHNLSEDFLSTIAPGTLVPFYMNVGLNGDSFEMDLEAAVRTLPTEGPLFGSFKLQADMFVCPIRLYQGLLHNNALNLGLNMKDVLLPTIHLIAPWQNKTTIAATKKIQEQISKTNLLNYLGIKGIGIGVLPNDSSTAPTYVERDFNALGVLSYYDIYKNYYANKQEDNGYIVGQENIMNPAAYKCQGKMLSGDDWSTEKTIDWRDGEPETELEDIGDDECHIGVLANNHGIDFNFDEAVRNPRYWKFRLNGVTSDEWFYPENEINNGNIEWHVSQDSANPKKYFINIKIKNSEWLTMFTKYQGEWQYSYAPEEVQIVPFPLENIDKMRYEILAHTELGTSLEILTDNGEIPLIGNPYYMFANTLNGERLLKPMLGLALKTYQSDIYNNWLKTDLISGENGINEITKIDTTNGLTQDALLLQNKVYNMLNRITMAGGTYQNWQQAVFTDNVRYICETPEWVGGYSNEVVFEEVVQTTGTESDPLGSLGGRGRLLGNKKGGKISFKIYEPSIIMGIVSITPRINYTQGNEWYNTELKSIDDLHKPALDGIGFQELITEQMAWWDAELHGAMLQTQTVQRHSAGFTPAWINYMTSVNKAYGDFAELTNKGFMILGRNYNVKYNGRENSLIEDLTTYVDPSKFNYAFADAELTAQNFWVEVKTDIKARRLMSAKIIPNL